MGGEHQRCESVVGVGQMGRSTGSALGVVGAGLLAGSSGSSLGVVGLDGWLGPHVPRWVW